MPETHAHSEQSLPLTATDLKQWAYCKRVVYYHHVMPVEFARTYKMERGRDVEAAVEAMEKRRGFRRYGLDRGERRFGAWVTSQRLGLAGKLDLLIVTDDACYPVDFKDTDGGVRRNHRIQLTAYALMVEETFGRTVPAAFVYLVPSKELIRVELDADLRHEVLSAVDEIRGFVHDEEMPDPTPVRARCVGCEFRNYCDDIW
ncbi:MAG: CRISPR-associated protein Cas4 [Candidatus Binataceae bacterium]